MGDGATERTGAQWFAVSIREKPQPGAEGDEDQTAEGVGSLGLDRGPAEPRAGGGESLGPECRLLGTAAYLAC